MVINKNQYHNMVFMVDKNVDVTSVCIVQSKRQRNVLLWS